MLVNKENKVKTKDGFKNMIKEGNNIHITVKKEDITKEILKKSVKEVELFKKFGVRTYDSKLIEQYLKKNKSY